jgi:hypothetical protein
MPSFDSLSWLADRLVGQHAYSRNMVVWGVGDVFRNEETGETYRVASLASESQPVRMERDLWFSKFSGTKPFDQESERLAANADRMSKPSGRKVF